MSEQADRIEIKLDRILALLEKPKPLRTLSGRGRAIEYTDEFSQIWAMYPKRAGNNTKSEAYQAFNARLRNGATVIGMRLGVERYKAFCDATGATGSQYVLMASTFFGPQRPWEQDWSIPAPEVKTPKTDADWEELAAMKGLTARMGESWDTFKQRIQGART